MWIAVAAAVLVVTASALALRSLRIVPSVAGRLWLPANPARGGVSMANFRRRMQSRGETDAAGEQPQDEVRGGEGISDVAAQRLLAYSVTSPEPAADEGVPEAPAGPADEDTKPAEAEAQVDLAAVGEEVGAVLTSAQEAAAAIRRAAELKAERVRAEAKAAAAAEVQEAKRAAEADRAEGARVRAEAERQAGQALDEANRRLQAADAEAERRIAQADEKARERVTTLRAETAQHEERIRSMVAVFRGVTAQLEDLLVGKRAERSDETAAGERLDDALRPDASRTAAPVEGADAPR
jgi:hypothetical protein